MSENLHEIDQYFKNGLEGFEEEPGRGVWEALDNQLDKVETVRLRHKYARLRYWTVAVTVVLTTALILLYNSNLSHKSSKPEVTSSDSPTIDTIITSPRTQNPTIKNIAPEEITLPTEETASHVESNHTIPNKDQISKRTIPQKNEMEDSDEKSAPLTVKNSIEKENPQDPYKREASSRVKNIQTREKNGFIVKNSVSKTSDVIPKSSNKNRFVAPNSSQEKTYISKIEAKEDLYLYPSLPKTVPTFSFNGLNLPTEEKSGILPNLGSIPHLKISRKKIFAFGVFYSTENNNQRLEEGRREHDEDDNVAIKNGESMQTSYSYGAMGSYTINQKFSLQTGIAYLHKLSTIAEKQIFARKRDPRMGGNNDVKFKFNCAAGFTYIDPKLSSGLTAGDSIKVSSSINELSYLEIPLLLNFKTGKKKLHFNFLGGFSANFLQKGTIQTSLVSSSIGKLPITNNVEGLKQHYFSGMVGAGVEYDLHPSLSIFTQEVYKGSLESINSNAPTKTFSNGTGLQMGIRFKM